MWAFVFFALWALSPSTRIYVINANNASALPREQKASQDKNNDFVYLRSDIRNQMLLERRLFNEQREEMRNFMLEVKKAPSLRNKTNCLHGAVGV